MFLLKLFTIFDSISPAIETARDVDHWLTGDDRCNVRVSWRDVEAARMVLAEHYKIVSVSDGALSRYSQVSVASSDQNEVERVLTESGIEVL